MVGRAALAATIMVCALLPAPVNAAQLRGRIVLSAADSLGDYGSAAIPALKDARVPATENGKWWIYAALQAIDTQASSTQTTPEVIK